MPQLLLNGPLSGGVTVAGDEEALAYLRDCVEEARRSLAAQSVVAVSIPQECTEGALRILRRPEEEPAPGEPFGSTESERVLLDAALDALIEYADLLAALRKMALTDPESARRLRREAEITGLVDRINELITPVPR